MANGYSLRKRKIEFDGLRPSKKLRVGRRKNTGLISLLNPTNIVASISESNCLQSPLLRLPAELRNYVFKLVLGGMEILIKSKENRRYKNANPTHYRAIRLMNYTRHRISYGSPVKILRVSRQIYLQCSTLVYTLNTFDFANPIALKIWYLYRRKAQIDMVHTIKVNDDILFLTKNRRLELQPLTSMFPNLTTVVMGPYRYEDSKWQRGISDEHTMDAWGNEAIVKQGERDDLKVVFEPLL
ncbi:hypothetical protein CC86DRAFT_401812 [Ophiobolus disseminans]|uniref:DUF7730 domain-containing protein n=1 Tax=Ophiobolus disseminans TaxID=1469910 RepID=A0A6A7AEZ4_9PLEO|nr:hypothetical protein CC86DRAFT_401812 [Ophiobolus disseminans]